jgi:hypothetical protein
MQTPWRLRAILLIKTMASALGYWGVEMTCRTLFEIYLAIVSTRSRDANKHEAKGEHAPFDAGRLSMACLGPEFRAC